VQLHFADRVIDCDRYEFLRAGQRIDVQPKVWAFLRLLAENAHRLLPKDEILERLWPDVVVAEGSLQRLASLARAALGDERLLRTVRGVGYQLAAEVQVRGGEPAAEEAAAGSSLPAASPTASSQVIRYCRTIDGANVAWASFGRGPALVRALGWFSNLEYEWAWPHARRFWELLGEGRRLIRYDGRGMGLSDPWSDFSPELRLRDLEAVIAGAGEQRFDLVGLSEGCGTALAFAARNPARVRRLVLYGPPAFLFLETTPELQSLGRVMRELVKAAWGGGGSDVFGQMLAQLFVGQTADADTRDLFDRMQRASTDRDTALAYLRAMAADARDEARKLSVPTLVVHRRGDAIAPFESAKAAAALIPGARFVPLAGDNHWPMANDPSAPVMIRSIAQFLDEA
jgi:pimeloyl-ACP methyl ester carboxylesterase/DNA-binding winged helix-turn-helix (wHTH) protein